MLSLFSLIDYAGDNGSKVVVMEEATSSLVGSYKGKLVFLFVVGIVAVVVRILYVMDGNLIYDDSYITYRYADNIIRGLGFVYNPGEFVLGVTTPLWVLILAVVGFLGVEVPGAAIVLGILFDVASVLLLFEVLSNHNQGAAMWAAVIWAVYPPAVTAASGGMETSMFIALSLASLMVISRNRYKPSHSTFAVLASITRPEGIIIYSLSLMGALRTWRSNRVFVLIMIVVPAVLFVAASSYFGTAIPQSVLAKRSLAVENSTVIEILRGLFPGITIVLVPFAICGAIMTITRRSIPLIVVWTTLYLIAYLLARPKMWVWYYLPMQMGVVVMSAVGINFVFAFVHRIINNIRKLHYAVLPMIAFSFLIPPTAYYYFPRGTIGENIEVARYRKLAAYIKESTLAEDAVLASDIGYVGYYSGRKILDSWGLVWRDAMEFEGTIEERVPKIAKKYLPKIVVAPAYRANIEVLRNDEWFQEHYRITNAFFVNEEELLNINLDELPENWSSQYLVYSRVNGE
jgi:arabinofuranosyltransferase